MVINFFSNLAKRCSSFIGIRGKIMGIVIISIILLATLLILQAENMFTGALRKKIKKQGISLAQYIAVRSENFLLTNNFFGLHQLIMDSIDNNQELSYILIFDSDGRLVADSFDEGLPEGLMNFNHLQPGDDYNSKVFRTEAGLIHDIAVPIWQMENQGVIRIGISEASINTIIKKLRNLLLFSTILISILSLSIAYLLSALINKPLKKLVFATERIGAGELDYRVSLNWAEDELGKLGTAFNQMAVKLQKTAAERKKLWKELQHKEEKRQYLLNKVIMAQEEERKRVARELHDETSQALTSLNLALATLEDAKESEEFNAKVEMMKETVTEVLDEINLLARQLRPSTLDNLGLSAAIKHYVKNASQRWGDEIGLHINSLEGIEISKEVEITVYRIIQEALTNALRYSSADNISVIVNRKDNNLLIIVEDDGCGFDLKQIKNEEQSKEHLGLFGMQERAKLLGGELTIETEKGIGTTIYVTIPLSD